MKSIALVLILALSVYSTQGQVMLRVDVLNDTIGYYEPLLFLESQCYTGWENVSKSPRSFFDIIKQTSNSYLKQEAMDILFEVRLRLREKDPFSHYDQYWRNSEKTANPWKFQNSENPASDN